MDVNLEETLLNLARRARGKLWFRKREPGPASRGGGASGLPISLTPPPRLAGALDISSCPQSRKNVLYDKAREAFGTARTVDAYYSFTPPPTSVRPRPA